MKGPLKPMCCPSCGTIATAPLVLVDGIAEAPCAEHHPPCYTQINKGQTSVNTSPDGDGAEEMQDHHTCRCGAAFRERIFVPDKIIRDLLLRFSNHVQLKPSKRFVSDRVEHNNGPRPYGAESPELIFRPHDFTEQVYFYFYICFISLTCD